tara:strand:- start:1710 stop:2189 length:480 start_codon:yes stop_codon:yes gene_type:complete
MIVKNIRFYFTTFLLSIFLSACFSYEEVEILDIKSIKLVDFSDKEIIVNTEVEIFNPNDFDIKVVKSEFDVFMKGDRIGKAYIDNKLKIKKNSRMVHALVLKSDHTKEGLASIPKLLALTMNSPERIQFKVDGFIVGKAFLFKKKIHVSHQGLVPLKFY